MSRSEAEFAFKTLYGRLFVDHKKLKLLWAKTQLDPNSIIKKKKEKDIITIEKSED